MADLICNVTLSPPLTVNVSFDNTGPAVPAATAENDFIVAGPTPFAWLKKTLAQVKVILGLGSAAYVTLDASNRFVSDTEKGTWNGKQPSGSYLIASDITGKVDKVAGSSLLADTQLALLKHEILGVACSDLTSNLAASQVFAFDIPFSCVITRVFGSLTNAATGNAFKYDVQHEGATILAEDASIAAGANNGETSTFTGGANGYAYTKGDLISGLITVAGSLDTGKGLIIFLEGYRT